MISRTRAGDIKEVTFGIVDFLQIGIIANRLYTLLQWNDLISQAITATARNSRPLARCMVPIET